MREYDEPPEMELIRPEDFLARNGSPGRTKPSHRIIAWLLVAVLVVPLLFGVSRQLF